MNKHRVQKVNRIYATKDTRYGLVKKVKIMEMLEDENGKYYINKKGNKTYRRKVEGDTLVQEERIALCPNHAIIDNEKQIKIGDIDKQYYIDLAWEKINKFIERKELENGK